MYTGRALASEALGLFLAALQDPKDFKQLQLLLQCLKRSLTQPFQQLPTVIAAFAAEAALVLTAPGHAVYSPVNKLLLQSPELDIQVIRHNLLSSLPMSPTSCSLLTKSTAQRPSSLHVKLAQQILPLW